MIDSGIRSAPFRQSWVLATVAMVVLWRVAALVSPSAMVSISEGLRLPLALLGALFLACGVGASWVCPGRWTAVFLVYGVGGAIHWGGMVGPGHAGLELSLLFVYLALSAVSEAALLHLALIFPSGRRLGRGLTLALYCIPGLALLVAPFASLLPKTVLGWMAGGILGVASGFSVVAGVVFVVSLIRVNPATRRAASLPLIVASMIVTFIVSTLGTQGILLAQSEAWNLVVGLVPIALCLALVRAPTDLPQRVPR